MKKVLTILGARPQFVKAAVLSRSWQARHGVQEILVHTGQHYDADMSDVFFTQMQIPEPAYKLTLSQSTQGAMTGEMLVGLERIVAAEKPDAILVYGDTNSTLAGALTAAKMHIPLVHVEAGLRSFNRKMPEEINRVLTDQLSQLLFVPADSAIENLAKEGIAAPAHTIEVVGDIMKDAVLHYRQFAKVPSFVVPDKYMLATVHRAENTDDPEVLKGIFEGLDEINKSLPVILPLHPRTKLALLRNQIKTDVQLVEPQGYFQLLWLLDRAQLVATDSGGLQKEAAYLHKFCITLRGETEWTELVSGGVNRLVAANTREMAQAFQYFSNLEFPAERQFYGDGHTGGKIADKVAHWLK
ncbi:MAG TPA: UDP-N-acetylglucosamine 2-epimerase (non-hydrolyzing) [Luteibaculaceae bacterium]|nr:UDP-N-acetylglucosamine 2-epimerase (non-hydrolyzing) [Luteibaculaceae bacterium]